MGTVEQRRTVSVDPDSELARALEHADEAPVVLESNGTRFTVSRAEDDLDERERRLQRLRAELAIGEEQEKRGELIELTPERIEAIKRQARDNARNGKPIKDAVKP